MPVNRRSILAAVASLVMGCAAHAQDLYDTTVLRTMNFQFRDANWLTLLRSNYAAQINIIADLTVDGVTYPGVGVRIRGNTSYTALPAGSEKFSLNVEIDTTDTNQTLMGYKALNLNNAFHDPTFCREALYNNYVAQYIPNGRSNHVVVTLNGQNWGVYVNVQQFDRVLLGDWFSDPSGLRIKCANTPNGPGLRYNGATQAGYTGYEIKDPGGLADPWAPLIATCNAVTNGVVANWPTTIDPIFAVDPSIWSVVLENLLTDDDSYVNKGADFVTYRNPTDQRMYLLQTDANETFTATTWAINRNFTQTNKPVLNRVLSVAELRQRYFAHYRTTMQGFTWTNIGAQATAMRNLIDAAVQADPKKLYTHALFQQNFTTTVTMPYPGLAGGTVPGLQQFVNERTTSLLANAELAATGPSITAVQASDSTPNPGDAVTITADVAAAGSPVSRVDVFYRSNQLGTYQRLQMTAGAPGVYTAVLPITGTRGQLIEYYVSATAANTFSSLSFFPARTEWAPLQVEYTFGATGGMRVTEFMYSGPSGEFIELTNRSDAPIDMTGWRFDDDRDVNGGFVLSSLGTVAPNESVIVTESSADTFRAAWGLPASVKIIGQLGAIGVGGDNLGRNDDINLFNATGVLQDRLRYGDQTHPGTIRTQNVSGNICRESIGQNDAALWTLSAVGDRYGSVAASTLEVGSPGFYAAPSCNPCVADMDDGTGTGTPDGGVTIDDLLYYLALFEGGVVGADVDDGTSTGTRDGGVTIDDLLYYLLRFEAGC